MKKQKNTEVINRLRIADMEECEKPRERIISEGSAALSDAELLALLLRCGDKNMSALNLAQLILNYHDVHKGINGLNYLSYKELIKIPGVGKTKACQILALCELSKRMTMQSFKRTVNFWSPSDIASYFMEAYRYLTFEKLSAIYLDNSGNFIKITDISSGNTNHSDFNPRDVFAHALKNDASYIILLHNHPSGDPTPSKADINTTKKLLELGTLLDVKILDHIILGDNCFTSLFERGLLDENRS